MDEPRLQDQQIIPCRKGQPSLGPEEIASYRQQLPEWEVIERDGVPILQRVFRFKNFAEALAFTNRVGALAEQENHHPALLTEWGKVTVQWWTHIIHGLHLNDFILAARTDDLAASDQP